MHTTENINVVVKIGIIYVCHLPWQQQHSHNSHKDSSAPLHNLNKQ
jgi:hypothetical protein